MNFIVRVLGAMSHLVFGRNEHLTIVLANQLLGSLGLLADLEKWVLSVHAVLLTGLTEVSVGAD